MDEIDGLDGDAADEHAPEEYLHLFNMDFFVHFEDFLKN